MGFNSAFKGLREVLLMLSVFILMVSVLGTEISEQNHSLKIDNSSIERVEQFKYLGTKLTDQNSIHEEIKSRLS